MGNEYEEYTEVLDLDDGFFEDTKVSFPPQKRQLTIRLDEDVVDCENRF